MATINFNANEVEPSVGFEAIPAGKYQAVIVDSDMKPNKAGTGEYLQLEFEVIEGEFKGRKLWTRLNLHNPNPDAVRMAQADLSAICHAVNVIQPGDSVELHNLPLTITVKCRKTPDGEIVNDIKGYAAKASAAGTAAAPATSAAVPQQPSQQGTAPSAPPWARQ